MARCFRFLSACVATALVSQFLGACGHETANDFCDSRPFIVGGTEVKAGEADSLSTVFFTDSNRNLGCSAVIVGPRQVVTAAHCFSDDNPWLDAHVAFATSVAQVQSDGPNSNTRKVSKVMRHEGFDGKFHDPTVPPFDIALVIFEGGIPAGYRPAKVLPSGASLGIGQSVVLLGFGRTGDGRSDNGQLRKVTTFLGKLLGSAKEVEFGPNPGKGACGGDSGGPAFTLVNGGAYLFAITSRGPTDSCEDGRDIYTDLRYFIGWIEQHGQFVLQH